MAVPDDRPYRHRGVHIPFVDAEGDQNQWSSNDDIQKDGFILIDVFGGRRIFLVQSVRTGDLFVNKVPRAGIYAIF